MEVTWIGKDVDFQIPALISPEIAEILLLEPIDPKTRRYSRMGWGHSVRILK